MIPIVIKNSNRFGVHMRDRLLCDTDYCRGAYARQIIMRVKLYARQINVYWIIIMPKSEILSYFVMHQIKKILPILAL